MKLNDLEKAATKAQQDLQLAERKAAELQRSAKAAKAKTEQARLKHKRVRKAAKQTKKLALAAEDQAREQRRAWEKAQKRLSKARKKLAKTEAAGAKKAAELAAKKLLPNAPEASEASRRQPVSVGCGRSRQTNPGESAGLTSAAANLADTAYFRHAPADFLRVANASVSELISRCRFGSRCFVTEL